MRKNWSQTEIGRRMREAAEARQLKRADLVRLLGVKTTTIKRWWDGERRPSPEDMARYAAAVGEPVFYLETGKRETEGAEEVVATDRSAEAMLLQWARLVQTGMSGADALQSIRRGTAQINEERSRELADLAPAMLSDLDARAGGDWAGLPEKRQLEIMRGLIADLKKIREKAGS